MTAKSPSPQSTPAHVISLAKTSSAQRSYLSNRYMKLVDSRGCVDCAVPLVPGGKQRRCSECLEKRREQAAKKRLLQTPLGRFILVHPLTRCRVCRHELTPAIAVPMGEAPIGFRGWVCKRCAGVLVAMRFSRWMLESALKLVVDWGILETTIDPTKPDELLEQDQGYCIDRYINNLEGFRDGEYHAR